MGYCTGRLEVEGTQYDDHAPASSSISQTNLLVFTDSYQ